MQMRPDRLVQWVARVVIPLMLATMWVSAASAASRQMLWQSRDQFVALESLEKGAEGANAHPAEVDQETLGALLASIDVRIDTSSAVEPLFTQAAQQAVVPHLVQALKKASPDQDVTFAVIGLHTSLYGLAKSPKVTTGRLFRRDGHLNLIIGMAQNDVNEREDRRLAPFIPGSRGEAAGGSWRILPRSGQDAFTLKRTDWVVFTDDPRALAVKAPEPVRQPQQQYVQPAAPVQQAAPAESRNPVERMTILNELRNKGLITEDEYKGKRQQILNGI